MEAASLAAIEANVGDDRKCRHCSAAQEKFREANQEVCGGISAKCKVQSLQQDVQCGDWHPFVRYSQ